MSRFPLIAARDMTYNTRRLKAGEPFYARNRTDVAVLVDITGKARHARATATIAAPPAALVEKVVAAVAPPAPPAPVQAAPPPPAAPAPTPAPKAAPKATPSPSTMNRRRRRATAKKPG